MLRSPTSRTPSHRQIFLLALGLVELQAEHGLAWRELFAAFYVEEDPVFTAADYDRGLHAYRHYPVTG